MPGEAGERGERTLVARVPDWPVVAAGFPADAPVVVVHANRVVAASAAARAAGVAVGLRRREAQGRCAEAEVVPADPSRDARAFDPVVAALDAITPRVEVRRPGEVALATRGPTRYHGGDEALAARVGEVVGAVLAGRAPWHVGMADGAFAATCAAHPEARPRHPADAGGFAGPPAPAWSPVRSSPSPPSSPGATSAPTTAATPSATVVEPGGSPAFLAPWPVAVAAAHLALDGADDVAGVLVRLGVRTLGDLAGLPAPDLLARFGHEGELLHRLARGLDPRPLAARRPAPELAVAVELDPPVERVDVLAFRAVALADALHARLARDGLACLRIGIEVETEHGEHRRRSWRHEGGLSAAAVAERARWQLDGWLSGPVLDRPTAGITRLRLDPEEVVAARGRQLGFWGGETRIDEGAARALARVAALLGTDAVVVPEVQGGRGPGDRVAVVPVAAVDLSGRTVERPGTDGPWPGRLPAPSPALVHPDPPPVELRADDGSPVVVDGRGAISAPPRSLGGRDVVGWAGPWPADERWWDPLRARRRARVQVVLADGTAHLLALEAGRWHLEATYD